VPFVLFGPVVLLFDILVDMHYFWKNSFRNDLQKIIIEKEVSTVQHKTLKDILNSTRKYVDNKVKSANCTHIILNFRSKFRVNPNLQFLLFGQIIPEGGFKASDDHFGKGYTFKTLKT